MWLDKWNMIYEATVQCIGKLAQQTARENWKAIKIFGFVYIRPRTFTENLAMKISFLITAKEKENVIASTEENLNFPQPRKKFPLAQLGA